MAVASLAATSLFAVAAAAQNPTARDIALHVLNRIGYGPTPALLRQLSAGPTAVSSYIAAQLSPPSPLTENATVTAMLAPLSFAPTSTAPEFLLAQTQLRAAYSDWQLNELMTRFWNDHFNRSFSVLRFSPTFAIASGFSQPLADGYAVHHLHADDTFYRGNALTHFDTLLAYTAASASMLVYLDNHLNKAGAPNQNWGRELLELFTMGEFDASTGLPNYNQADVITCARAFTGWTVAVGGTPVQITTAYDPNGPTGHDNGAKTLFQGLTHSWPVPVNTAQLEGNAVLAHLAGMPQTADFVIRKMMTLIFGEHVLVAPMATGYQSMLTGAKSAWGTRGDITAVLNVLLTSPEFVNAADAWRKIKNPLHHDASLLRVMNASPDYGWGPLVETMLASQVMIGAMGQPMFGYETPDGYPMTNIEQLGPGGFVDRIDSAERFMWEPGDLLWHLFWGPGGWTGVLPDPLFDPAALVLDPTHGVAATGGSATNSTDVAVFLVEYFFGDKPIAAADVTRIATYFGTLPTPGTQAYADYLRAGCELIASYIHFDVH
jgi:uncharacterized protein (DUF1800 family)